MAEAERRRGRFSMSQGIRKLGPWTGLFTWILSRLLQDCNGDRLELDAEVFTEELNI